MLEPFGKICLVDHPRQIDFAAGRSKSSTLHWQAMFTRSSPMTEASAQQGRHLTRIAQWCDAGIITPLPVKPATPLTAASITTAIDRIGTEPRPVFVANPRTIT